MTGQNKDDAMLQQLSDGVRINNERKKNVMNTKGEWNYVHVLHVAVE